MKVKDLKALLEKIDDETELAVENMNVVERIDYDPEKGRFTGKRLTITGVWNEDKFIIVVH